MQLCTVRELSGSMREQLCPLMVKKRLRREAQGTPGLRGAL